jgi:hypothetical protein
MKYKKFNTSDVNTYNNSIIPEDSSIVLNDERDLKIGDGVTQGGKHLIKRAQDIIFNESTISTANTNQNLTITTNGSGDIYIGADRNMIFDMNAFTGKGILIQDSQEDGYDDSGSPSTLKVGSIYHEQGRMTISSDGSIINVSGIQVDVSGNPTDNSMYGGIWITNGQDTGFLVPGPTGSLGEIFSGSNIEIHNNEKIWEFTQSGNLTLPENGNITFSDGSYQSIAGVVSNTGSINGATAITNMIKISQVDYDGLVTKDSNTLYFIV